jgi:FKBP-type peptidyl-prolyl cis-trans isomerase
MFKKYELIGGALSVLLMATALYLVQARTHMAINQLQPESEVAAVVAIDAVMVEEGKDDRVAQEAALRKAFDNSGKLKNMVIDDVKVGDGQEVVDGDTVSVHYVGTLQNGTEFDNSKKRGQSFEFTVGAGQVIRGWEEGLVGMKVGGTRILVIPPEMGYGDRGIGPIPPGATLVFSIELVEIK